MYSYKDKEFPDGLDEISKNTWDENKYLSEIVAGLEDVSNAYHDLKRAPAISKEVLNFLRRLKDIDFLYKEAIELLNKKDSYFK